MKTYRFDMKHDNGNVTIYIKGDTLEQAKLSVMTAEKCPESAFTYWGIVPTKKQIAKTKSLLRGI